MADTPKATPMTFREAVDIVSRGFDGYAESDVWAKWDRARAIVDQAVKAHKARCDSADAKTMREAYPLMDKSFSEFDKLRALERGESEVQP